VKPVRHIAFVTPGFARDAADTACTPYLQDYFRALHAIRPDWRISILAMQYPFQQRKYRWEGMEVHPMGGRNRKLAKPLTWRRTALTLKQLHQTHPIDILHSFWLQDATHVAAKVARKLQIPHFASAMGQDVHPANRYLRRLKLDGMKVIALSTLSRRTLEATTGRIADVIIPFGIAPVDVDASASPDRPMDLLAVGNLIPLKRHDRFVRIVRMLADERPSLQAMLIGEGPCRRELEAQIRELKLEGHLRLAGSMSRPEVLQAMSQARVLVHSSETEGHGMVLTEALARGAHLVATPVGLSTDLLHTSAADKCMISDHTFGLAEAALEFLRNPVDWAPRNPYPIAQTVADHLHLYGLDG
jgi:1,2-diacylglycerol 3-alpha-glucosyltransferase